MCDAIKGAGGDAINSTNNINNIKIDWQQTELKPIKSQYGYTSGGKIASIRFLLDGLITPLEMLEAINNNQ